MAQQLQHLRGFVYVSTAYVNANLPRGSHVEERVYPLLHSSGNRILHGHLAAQLAALPASKAEHLVHTGILSATHACNSVPANVKGPNTLRNGVIGLLPAEFLMHP